MGTYQHPSTLCIRIYSDSILCGNVTLRSNVIHKYTMQRLYHYQVWILQSFKSLKSTLGTVQHGASQPNNSQFATYVLVSSMQIPKWLKMKIVTKHNDRFQIVFLILD